ncbi:twin-arginine translocation signal domain-containing protein [Anaerovibrio sp. RM50]|uniref:amidohydrolase family protein n=1 Tax=Anaerovibrio sp. RM50 TaxID=1200557 RepID=UPI0018DEAA7F|nr:twin-arginine translocation signal domain-containing protein [Anaerovibrio sp. RM50]
MAVHKKDKTNSISRRDFLKLSAAAGIALTGLGGNVAKAGTNEAMAEISNSVKTIPLADVDQIRNKKIKIVPPKEAVRYEIIDSHLHFTDFLQKSDGFPALCRAMDMAGVKKSVIFGMPIAMECDSHFYYYSATDYLVAQQLLAQPDEIRHRFYPFCCGFNCNDKYAADHLERLLHIYPDFWRGIGEIMSRHDDLTAHTYGEVPHMDGGGFLGIYDVAAQKGLPVLVHHNITAQNTERILYLHELKNALAYNRQCNIIWAHIGISRQVEVKELPQIAHELLRDNKNLWMDISWLVYDHYFLDKFPDNYYDGNTMEDWVELIERHPDRFLLGTDKVGHWQTYPAEVMKYYPLLDKLKPSTVAAICHNNLLSLIKKY